MLVTETWDELPSLHIQSIQGWDRDFTCLKRSRSLRGNKNFATQVTGAVPESYNPGNITIPEFINFIELSHVYVKNSLHLQAVHIAPTSSMLWIYVKPLSSQFVTQCLQNLIKCLPSWMSNRMQAFQIGVFFFFFCHYCIMKTALKGADASHQQKTG